MVVRRGDNSGSSLHNITILSSTANIHLNIPVILILSSYGVAVG